MSAVSVQLIVTHPEFLGNVVQQQIKTDRAMASSSTCFGHKEREDRLNKIGKRSKGPKETPDENLRILIKKGPVSVETSLKELEDNYEKKPEWKLIEDGGVLSIPVEELRMENPPRPDRSGQVVFKEKKGGGGRLIILNSSTGMLSTPPSSITFHSGLLS